MNRQYIGARYVPKFYEGSNGNEWDVNVPYEPLTIVTYLGNSYTSKIPVPANVGAPNLNPTYWVLTSNYSAQIEEYRQQVEGVQRDLDDLEDYVKEERTELLLFGDSWSDYEHDPTHVRIPQVLEQGLELTVHNYSYGGTGFDVPNGYDEQIEWYEADTSFDHSKVKYVVLVAGLNEYNGGTTKESFASKLDDWLTKIYAVIPENTPVYWFHNYSLTNDSTRPIPTYFYNQRNYYRDVPLLTTKKCRFASTFGWADCSNFNTDNWYHLTADGSTQFAENMVKAINGIAPTIYMYDSHTGVADTTAVGDALKNTPTQFFVEGSELIARIYPTMALLGNCTSGTQIEYTGRDLPARIVGTGYLTQGMILGTNTYNSVELLVMNNSERTWGAAVSGRFRSSRINTEV